MQEDSRTVVMRVAALAGNRAARLLDVPKLEKHNKYSSGSLRSVGGLAGPTSGGRRESR